MADVVSLREGVAELVRDSDTVALEGFTHLIPHAAGASNLPCAIMRGYVGTDLVAHTQVEQITCPFTGERLAAVPALRPDVGIVHAQRADRAGNVLLEGIVGVQKEIVLASRQAIVTVEEVVDDLRPPSPNSVVLPAWTVSAVVEAPRGAYPSYAHGYYGRDNAFYTAWDAIARDRDTFQTWMREHVLHAEVAAHGAG